MLSDALEIPYPTTFFDLTLHRQRVLSDQTGKEATVRLRGGPRSTPASSWERSITQANVRSFQNDAAYREGRFVGDSRLRRAMAKKTRTGR